MASDPFQGMNPSFASKIRAIVAASHGQITIESGHRDTKQQQQLWNAALKKYGSAQAAARYVAPPGHSHHELGIAADLGGNLALAHQLAAKFGLYNPMSWEPWHFESTSPNAPASPGAPAPAPSSQGYTPDPATGQPPAPAAPDAHDPSTQIHNFLGVMMGGTGVESAMPAAPEMAGGVA